MYAQTRVPRRQAFAGFGASASGAAAGAAVGSVVPGIGTAIGSLIGGLVPSLFGTTPRLTSGVKQSVYNDEISDSRITLAIDGGPASLAQFITGTMMARAGTAWGTAYSPEAILWARQKLSQLAGLTAVAPIIPAAAVSQTVADQATAAVRAAIVNGDIPPDLARAIQTQAQVVVDAAQQARITGTAKAATGIAPTTLVMLAGGALLVFVLARRH